MSFVFVLSSFGGLILDKTVSDPNFEGMAIFTPVINGKQASVCTCHMVILMVFNEVLQLKIDLKLKINQINQS